MKVIGILMGAAAYREVQEEYAPKVHPAMHDVIQTVRGTFQFQQFPMLMPNMPHTGIWVYGNGKFQKDGQSFGITQLIMTPQGDSVSTGSTELSEFVLDHFIDLMDAKFGYRLRESTLTKHYWSHVVVEFGAPLAELIEKIGVMERAISARVGKGQLFHIKNVTFTTTTAAPVPNADPIDVLSAADFIIERRLGQPFEQNRFFSTAPLSTPEHIKALQEIEEALRG